MPSHRNLDLDIKISSSLEKVDIAQIWIVALKFRQIKLLLIEVNHCTLCSNFDCRYYSLYLIEQTCKAKVFLRCLQNYFQNSTVWEQLISGHILYYSVEVQNKILELGPWKSSGLQKKRPVFQSSVIKTSQSKSNGAT